MSQTLDHSFEIQPLVFWRGITLAHPGLLYKEHVIFGASRYNLKYRKKILNMFPGFLYISWFKSEIKHTQLGTFSFFWFISKKIKFISCVRCLACTSLTVQLDNFTPSSLKRHLKHFAAFIARSRSRLWSVGLHLTVCLEESAAFSPFPLAPLCARL